MPFEDAPDSGYNSMQQQAGLLPAAIAVPPPIVFPGQISAMLASGGPGAAMSILPMNNPFANSGFGGMGGYPAPGPMMAPQMPNPMAAMLGNPSSAFSPAMPAPPPMYAGRQPTPSVFGSSYAPSQFNTPYAGLVEQQIAEDQQSFANYSSYAGLGTRVGFNVMAGIIGAKIGRHVGGGFGAAVGGLGAIAGSEYFGAGQFAQNTFMEQVMAPRIQQRGFAGGLEHLSGHFMPVGSGPLGTGFNAAAAERAAESIQNLGNSANFRRETFDRFNASDVAAITQGAGHAGLLGGVTNVEQMTSRVRDVAKSLGAFMELAQEPDIQRALQTMGNLRSSGLNLSETLGAVQSGRAFARLAGMSFQEMAEVGGGAGAGMFQNFGMSAGAGMRAGMANLGMAYTAANAGYVNPAMMSMLRGPQGMAAAYNQFSANMMSMPMLAPAMMTATGGLNIGALHNLASGGGNLFSMTGAGANNLSALTSTLGVGGLGMAVSMQPMLRDQISRMLQTQGPYAQRNMEDSQILGLARGMGLRGTQGFITAARAAGLDESAAVARAMEVTSPTFYAAQRQEGYTRLREAREDADRRREQAESGVMDILRNTRGIGPLVRFTGDVAHHTAEGLSFLFGGEENRDLTYTPTSDIDRRRQSRLARSRDFGEYMKRFGTPRGGIPELSNFENLRLQYNLATGMGRRGIAALGSAYNTSQEYIREDGELVRNPNYLTRDQVRTGSLIFREGARLSENLLYEDRRGEAIAAGRIDQTFGGGAQGRQALANFSRRIATMGGTENFETMMGNFAFGAAFTRLPTIGALPITPGNLFGSRARGYDDYRLAFIESMKGRMSPEQAGRMFDQNSTQIMQQAAPYARLGMDAQDVEQVSTTIDIGRSLVARDPGRVNFAASKDAGASLLFGGEHGHRVGRGVFQVATEILGGIEGVGTEGSEKSEKSRRMIAMLAMVNSAVRTGTPEQKRRARQILEKLQAEGSSFGFTSEEQVTIANRAQGVAQSFGDRTEAQIAARGFVDAFGDLRTGQEMLERFGRGESQIQMGQLGENVQLGATLLGGMQGVLGDLGRTSRGGRMTPSTFDMGQLSRNIEQLAQSPEKIRQLARGSAFERRLAALLQRKRRGEDVDGEIREMIAQAGEIGTRAKSDIEGSFSYRIRAMNPFGGANDARDYLQRELAAKLTPTSGQERTALGSVLNAIGAEGEMRDQGIGAAGDALLTSAQELRRVAEAFRDATTNLPNLVNP